MMLEIENEEPVDVESFQEIQMALCKLKNHGPNSFAILNDETGKYVQVAGRGEAI